MNYLLIDRTGLSFGCIHLGGVLFMGKQGKALVGIIVLIGLAYLYYSAVEVNREMQVIKVAADNVHWPAADAVITECSIQPSDWEERNSGRPFVKYQYQVGDQTYESDRISIASKLEGYYNDFELVRAFRDKFKVGSHHQAFYNKDDPGYAFLIPGAQRGTVYCDGLKAFTNFALFLVLAAVIFPNYDRFAAYRQGSEKLTVMVGAGLAILAFLAIMFLLIVPACNDWLFNLYVPKESNLSLSPQGYSVGGSQVHPF